MSDEHKAPDTITFDDFLKVDIRVGEITKSEAVPKSDKLVKLEVYFGSEIGYRTIMAGIAKSYHVEMLVGTRVLAVVNLAPRKMMGVESHGMLLAGHDPVTGTVTLATCMGVPWGERIG
jgi:methionyl-tRNA synthetase